MTIHLVGGSQQPCLEPHQILLAYLIAKQLFRSEFVSLVAAALMALDGLHLVMSRTALLDIFLSFFILLAFYLLIKEKLWWAGLVFGLALGTTVECGLCPQQLSASIYLLHSASLSIITNSIWLAAFGGLHI